MNWRVEARHQVALARTGSSGAGQHDQASILVLDLLNTAEALHLLAQNAPRRRRRPVQNCDPFIGLVTDQPLITSRRRRALGWCGRAGDLAQGRRDHRHGLRRRLNCDPAGAGAGAAPEPVCPASCRGRTTFVSMRSDFGQPAEAIVRRLARKIDGTQPVEVFGDPRDLSAQLYDRLAEVFDLGARRGTRCARLRGSDRR